MTKCCVHTFTAHCPLSDETLLTNVMCGILSGVISSSIANPTDVLKVAIYFADGAVVLPLLVLVGVQRDKGGQQGMLSPCQTRDSVQRCFSLLCWFESERVCLPSATRSNVVSACSGGLRPSFLT